MSANHAAPQPSGGEDLLAAIFTEARTHNRWQDRPSRTPTFVMPTISRRWAPPARTASRCGSCLSGRTRESRGCFPPSPRAVGLDCGPLSGFDTEAVDKAFVPDGQYRTNFLCNIGYGDRQGVFDRLPRLGFDESCRVI